ncbi:type II secretion system major pseudopilin GspG [Candidatus Omnitrophota bacterium]
MTHKHRFGFRFLVYGVRKNINRKPYTVHRTPKRGFTLIELMLVVVIISVLAAMVVPRLVGRSQEARIAAAGADIESNLAVVLGLYELDNGVFPSTEQGLAALRVKPSGSPNPPNWKGPYIRKIPKDPWGNPYAYTCPGTNNTQDYDLYSYGPDGIESPDDINNWEEESE